MKKTASRITKKEAADRQLRQAIRLFFGAGDMLAVHTLAGSSFQLLADLGKRDGVVSRLRHSDRIRPENMTEWVNALNATQNFLKHADRDPDEEHEYVEESTLFLLFECVDLAIHLLKWDARERLAFEMWFAFSFSHLVQPDFMQSLKARANRAGADPTNKSLWLQWIGEA